MFPQSQMPQQIGPYKIVGELGRGSMGTVYLASQESLGRQIALKLLGPEFTRDEEFLERFRREGRTGASLRHPNIVQVFDLGEAQGLYYIAMEYGGSKDLKSVLQHQGGRLPMETALRYAREILSALDHAHSKGIVHRDVKPANIIVSDEDHAILTDFSVAQMKMASRLTQTGAAVGTPEYMSPEQFEGQGIDGRCDQYALGIILYEMLTGVQPFHGETVASVMKAQLFNIPPAPKTLNPNIPDAINAAIMRSLEKDSAKRFPDANQMSLALQSGSAAPAAVTQPMEVDDKQALLDNFLAAVASGQISLDEANAARDQVKAAIDMGYRKLVSVLVVHQMGNPNTETVAFFRSAVNNLLQKHKVSNFDWSAERAICLFQEPAIAVRVAVEIQQLIAQAALRRPDLSESVQTRIGVHTGEVYLDPRRSLGEFADSTVDCTLRLAKECPIGQVRVAEATMLASRSAFQFKEIGLNADQLKAFEVIFSLPTPTPVQPERVASEPLKPEVVAISAVTPARGTTAPRFCPGCAKPIETGLRICSQCGYEVGSLVPASKSSPKDEPKLDPVEEARETVPMEFSKPATDVIAAEPVGKATVNQSLPNEAVIPQGARLDLSGIKVDEAAKSTQDMSAAKAIRNAPKGYITEPIGSGQLKKEKPQQSLFDPSADSSAAVDKKAPEPKQTEPSAYFEFVNFAIKATGISGFACMSLSFGALLFSRSRHPGIWYSLWLGGTFGLPCLALGAFVLFAVSLFFIRDNRTTARALIVSIGLSIGAAVSAMLIFR